MVLQLKKSQKTMYYKKQKIKIEKYKVQRVKKYKKLKDEDNTILTLDELYKQISLINQNVDKILSNSDLLSCPILGYTILFKLIDLQCSIKA